MGWHETVLRTLPEYLALASPEERINSLKRHVEAVEAYLQQDHPELFEYVESCCGECQSECVCDCSTYV